MKIQYLIIEWEFMSSVIYLFPLEPWRVGVVGKVTAGYADGAGLIPALCRVQHGRRSFQFLSGLQYP